MFCVFRLPVRVEQGAFGQGNFIAAALCLTVGSKLVLERVIHLFVELKRGAVGNGKTFLGQIVEQGAFTDVKFFGCGQ